MIKQKNILAHMAEDNGNLRARLGSGEKGLNILLGGTLQDDQVTTTFSGAGVMSATYRTALVNKDVRLAAAAAGGSGGGGSFNPGYGGGDPTQPGIPVDPT